MRVEITIKKRSGQYKTFTKEFNDEQHFNNYMNILYNKEKVIGFKVIEK